MAASIRRNGKFGKALLAAMTRKKMNRSDLATAIDVQRATVKRWLPPRNVEPNDRNFEKLCTLFPELSAFA